MSEKRTVYVVTEGCYSDYHICAVFSTEEAAQRYVNLRQHPSDACSDYRIEPYDLDEPENQSLVEHVYAVVVDMQGAEVNRYEYDRAQHHWRDSEPSAEHVIDEQGKERFVEGTSTRGFDVALKAARDKVAEGKYHSARFMKDAYLRP